MQRAPTTQKIALVICGGGDPFVEYAEAANACGRLGLETATFVGNDMITHFPHQIDNAGTLHPDKLSMWTSERRAKGYKVPSRVWAHRPFSGVSDWTRDWAGSTGLFLVKIARELGHTHIVLCGVPMSVESNHFLRQTRWDACHGFRRGWTNQLVSIKGYVRSYSGWTRELFGAPTDEWLSQEIQDEHPLHAPRSGLKA
jgi:hypothetical protein